jgi:prolycopene isomerase
MVFQQGGFRVSPRCDSYDVVVVGAGMGGLTAGALLARAGKHVLVVDENERPGGFAASFRRGAYTFDTADHLITACEDAGPLGPGVIHTVLRHLGVRELCEFPPLDDPF